MPELLHADALRRCNTVDCGPPPAPAPGPAVPREPQPVDYMARDFDSFLRAMLDLLSARAPDWVDRSEADLGMALLELFAYLGDQLSYTQDRVANEAFLRTAVQVDSVRRLLRLIDYPLHPGRAAEALLLVRVSAPLALPAGFAVRSRARAAERPVVFETAEPALLRPELNQLALHGDASVDRVVLAAELAEGQLAAGAWVFLSGAEGGEWAQLASAPQLDTAQHTTTLRFREPLAHRYRAGDPLRANAVRASHGQSQLDEAQGSGGSDQRVALREAPLTYTAARDGTPVSSLDVRVAGERWHEVEDFIDSDPTDPHFRLSRDNTGAVTVHFGDGAKGRRPEVGDPIEVRYRTGIGGAGLVAADALRAYTDPSGRIDDVTNPEPARGAADPESIDEARRTAPRRLRAEPRRAVTADDFARVLLRGVRVDGRLVRPLHARARFHWTGSWHVAVVSVDLADRAPLVHGSPLHRALEQAAREVKLAGYEARVERARYAALRVSLRVHVEARFFAREVRARVERALASRPGTGGFFAPERFDFGRDVHLSDLYAAAAGLPGVRALEVVRFKRLGDRYPDRAAQGVIPIGPLEIARCDGDPEHPENGVLYVRTCGGRDG